MRLAAGRRRRASRSGALRVAFSPGARVVRDFARKPADERVGGREPIRPRPLRLPRPRHDGPVSGVISLTRTLARSARVRALAVLSAFVSVVLAAGLLDGPAASAASPSNAPSATAGHGIGDPYFPNAGNPGYRVGHYSVQVRYRPGSGLLTGDTDVRLVPERRLGRLSLDLVLRAHKVWVNGVRAAFAQTAHEL